MLSPDSIPTSTNLIAHLLKLMFEEEQKLKQTKIKNPESKPKPVVLFALAAAILLVLFTEPLKVIMRRNIGRNALSLFGIVASSIVYILFGLFLGMMALDGAEPNPKDSGIYACYLMNPYILWSAAVCYCVMAAFIIQKGFYEARQENARDSYTSVLRGDSIFMTSQLEAGVSQNTIWKSNEPEACLTAAITLTVIHPLIGFPILLTAIAFVVNESFQVDFIWSYTEQYYQSLKTSTQNINRPGTSYRADTND